MRGWLRTALLLTMPAVALAQPGSGRGAATVVAGECPEDASPSSVAALARSVREAHAALPHGAAVEDCVAVLTRKDGLRGIENLSRELGCRDGSPCAIRAVLDQVAAEEGLPRELVYATAWTESSWTQWKDGKPLVSRGGDVGILQLSPAAWGDRYDMEQAKEDLLYNARAGAKILKWAYRLARRKGYRGNDLLRSTYAIFNGGPGAYRRPWTRSRWSAHDRNFHRILQRKPWQAPVRSCS